MRKMPGTNWPIVVLGLLAVASTVAVGVTLRLDDPLSSPVVPAEDPYTHMALVREHLRDGNLDPLYDGGALYPPGMHAFVAASWVYTGADLYEIIRLGPALLGGVGVLGIGLLLWRWDGPVAAFVGSLGYAVAPEIVFRTTMMAPTALDLAIVPFLLYGYVELVRGRLGWTGVVGPMTVFLVFAHPWFLLVLALAALVFAVLAYIFPWTEGRGPPVRARGLAAALSIVGTSIALADMTAGSFRGTLNAPDWLPFDLVVLGFALLALIPAIILVLAPRWLDHFDRTPRTRPLPIYVRIGSFVLFAAALYLVTQAAVQQGMPEHVNLPRMFGWPILVLAAFGLVALLFMSGPVAYLGAALVATTYPFVVFNPLDSPFWPHRTAVFLGIGLVLLVGVAAGALFRAAIQAVPFGDPSSAPSAKPRRSFSPTLAVTIPALLVGLSLGGGVYGGTPPNYEEGWYRLYHPCDLDALREVAAQADAEPSALVMTGAWQTKLVLAALTEDAQRVWLKPAFFAEETARAGDMRESDRLDRPIFAVVDRYLMLETPDAEPGFLEAEPWVKVGSWCEGKGGLSRPSIILYRYGGAGA